MTARNIKAYKDISRGATWYINRIILKSLW
nr:MAG TPA: hypothetical protein [Caudoviricetes sp.]